MADLPFHPLADVFPLIEGAEFDELVSSIKESGQREPIVLLDGSILDGRNRYRACKAAGVEPVTKEFTGTDPLRFVVDVNIRRRHLSESQRSMIGARLANMKAGDNQHTKEVVEISTTSISAQEAAELMNVSRNSVVSAKTVLAEGTAEEIKAVQEGKAAVSTIAKRIRAERNKQTDGPPGSAAKASRKKRAAPGRTRQEQWRKPSATTESQHDRDLVALRGIWESACPSARAAFIRGLGYEPLKGEAA